MHKSSNTCQSEFQCGKMVDFRTTLYIISRQHTETRLYTYLPKPREVIKSALCPLESYTCQVRMQFRVVITRPMPTQIQNKLPSASLNPPYTKAIMQRHLCLHRITDTVRFAALNNRFDKSNICIESVEGSTRIRIDFQFSRRRRREQGHSFREIRG